MPPSIRTLANKEMFDVHEKSEILPDYNISDNYDQIWKYLQPSQIEVVNYEEQISIFIIYRSLIYPNFAPTIEIENGYSVKVLSGT